jgi:hypothetical protein
MQIDGAAGLAGRLAVVACRWRITLFAFLVARMVSTIAEALDVH